ncbi:MAG: alanine racemase [Rhodocyclaceae bacterium]|nr:alanine racemase [Rhodocyclaceae bacterium]MCA3026896.1 alanine racemase [Rhodocyclaceae bacterium]MCA3032948.1 alanine racemase [Rhodocyclaceae bacterium]MCA3038700.1 alanine racemase [Rhodocyclaceae bacterium]MCA3047895.1 alanine racemase [Rhodocyclaceae bacterium]
MTRPLRADISLSAIAHNYALAKRTAPKSKVFAVVKANAYGHGLTRVARVLKDADGFATLELDSAIQLRKLGVESPILMLEGFFGEEEINIFANYNLTTAIRDVDAAKQLADADIQAPLDVFLKFNTGMNRLGISGPMSGFAIGLAATHKNFGKVTLMTHFATADGVQGVAWQMKRFEEIVKSAKSALAKKGFTQSVANSAALLRFQKTHLDWVRPGIMLYGSSPFAERSAEDIGLKAVMTLRSEIIGVQTLEKGDVVGYGASYIAQKKMRVGIVACGYADGYPRHAPGTNERGTPVVVSGKRTRTIGRVSMDMLVVDLTDIPHAKVGAPVCLWGEGLPADEVATAAGTVAYELFCALAPRVPVVEVE